MKKDIIKIKSRRYLKTSFGLAQYVSKAGVLKITTQDKTFKLENVEDVRSNNIIWCKKSKCNMGANGKHLKSTTEVLIKI